MLYRTNSKRVFARVAFFVYLGLVAALSLADCGCSTSFSEWVHNGFKVGPNYHKPPVPLAKEWIDVGRDPRVRVGEPNLASWWTVFSDPVLNNLVFRSYRSNFSLRATAFQVLEQKARLALAVGELLPQAQTFDASYTRREISLNGGGGSGIGSVIGTTGAATGGTGGGTSTGAPGTTTGTAITQGGGGGGGRFFDNWSTSANLSWELDFWGKFRRAVASADASLDQSIENYDEALVILISNVATQYIQYRTLQRRIELAENNVKEEKVWVDKLYEQWKVNKIVKAAYLQIKTSWEQTQALIPPLQTALRAANDQLCLLLGVPVHDLAPELGSGQITAPNPLAKLVDDVEKTVTMTRIPVPDDTSVAVAIPGQYLLRRPDVQAAERAVKAQSEQIGIAEAEWYPHIAINGSIGLSADKLGKLFNTKSWNGSIGPSLTWNILEYGRILANVRFQDYFFQQLVATYQNTVLVANQEAEDALAAYLYALDQSEILYQAAIDATEALYIYRAQEKQGKLGDYNLLFTVQNTAVQLQDQAAQARGNIALNLILLYRAMGGGWQIRIPDAQNGCKDFHPVGPPGPGPGLPGNDGPGNGIEVLPQPNPGQMPNVGPVLKVGPPPKAAAPARFVAPAQDGPAPAMLGTPQSLPATLMDSQASE